MMNLIEETEKLAQKIASKSSVQTTFIKSLVNKGTDIYMNSAGSLEISYSCIRVVSQSGQRSILTVPKSV